MYPDLDQIDFTLLRLEGLVPSVQEWINDNLEKIMRDDFIPEMKTVAAAMNLPDGFIDGIEYRMVSKNKVKVVNTWGTRQKPLAKWFNYGTPKHWVAPRDPDGVLAFTAKEGRHGSAIYFQRAGVKTGETLFSKGHYVSGIRATFAMERGLEIAKKTLMAKFTNDCPREVREELSLDA